MELVVDAHGHPAPRLVDASLAREQVAGTYADLRRQAVGMLACGLIHGDLSPYNVLMGGHGPVIIDLPQVIDAAHNSQAETFFLRDVENIRRFCASLDPALRSEGDGREIWRAYVRRELAADFVPTGRAPEPGRAVRPSGGHRQQAHGGGAQGTRGAGRGQRTPRRPEGSTGPRRPELRGGRNAPAPEVIRVERLPHGAAGIQPPRGATAPAGSAPGEGRRRRRRRRGRG
jgi:RIO kinase 1